MVHDIRYRGPDDTGCWTDAPLGIGLGHVRLSIVDLSSEGRQPMVSASGRYVITYNGEVYNFKDLRKDLEQRGVRFRGHSDTEVILAGIDQWGLEHAVGRCVGMFAFGVWDRSKLILHLVRDRLGIKPLYFGWTGHTFLFGSELKAFWGYPGFRPDIDRNVLALYMRHNYVPAPYSMYQGLYKLPPGCVLAIGREQVGQREQFSPDPDDGEAPWKPQRYWSAKSVVDQGLRNPLNGPEGDIVGELDGLLRDAVRSRMISDVPLGAFLSGGIDSSTVVALMQDQSPTPVKTFTVGFSETEYNEAGYAKEVARHLGTDHTELYVSSAQAMAVIPRLPTLYNEPFGDSSQIPTFLISELARKQVTVSLSGDGGDELFGGYNRYFLTRELIRNVGWLPKRVRTCLGQGVRLLPRYIQYVEMLARCCGSAVRAQVNALRVGDRMYKLADLLAVDRIEAVYLPLISHWQNPAGVVVGGSELGTPLTKHMRDDVFCDPTNLMMYLDTITYLPDDILVKMDRASMGVSLEAREPLLDHRVVEFAWRIPQGMKIRGGKGKWVLRQVLARYVPEKLFDRPKMGFGVPLNSWLRGPLREWAESLLSESRLRQEGYFHPAPIRTKWEEHVSGRHDWAYLLWNVLMFQAWLEQWHPPHRASS